VHLPGEFAVSDLLAAGAAAPRTYGNLAERVVGSWSAIWPQVPAFDMRVGGLGILVLVALPVAAIRMARRCRGIDAVVMVLIVAATLATPEPAVARFVLAFAGLVLALAVPATEVLRSRAWVYICVFGLIAVGAAQNVIAAYPGLHGEGPPLRSYLDLSDAQRRRALGAAGPPAPLIDVVESLRPGERTLFDGSVELPYRAWPYDLSTAAERIPDDGTPGEVEQQVYAGHTRLLLVGDDTLAGRMVRDDPARFQRLFDCPFSACAVYIRR
jgi:hypothetical protein